ncbi:MFS transporter [Limosilactobacillus sp.]|uniref:MFS transporter n=1 Tax=Limosilactobacillus sp. TaxID=2773925 RepID=UPI003EFD792B
MRKYAILFFSTMFIVGLDSFMISAFLPILAKSFSVSTSQSGLLISAYAIGDAITALVAGPLSDGRDRKKFMIGGLLFFALGTLACGLSTNFVEMMIFEFISGVASAFITPQVYATVPVVVTVSQAPQLMGFATAGLSSSQILGIPVGSYLATINWRIPFFVLAVLALVLILVLQVNLPKTRVGIVKGEHSFFSNLSQVFESSSARKMLITYFVFQLGSFTTISFISTWFNHGFGLNLSQIGTAMILIGCGQLIGSLFSSRLIDAWGFKKTAKIEFACLVVLYILTPFSTNIVVADILLAFIYIFNGFLFPLLMTSLQKTVKDARSTISSLANSTMYLAETVAGMVGGYLLNHFTGFFGITIFSAIMIVIALLLSRKSILE